MEVWQMVTMKDEMEEWLNSRDSKDYFELLRFPTVGAEVAHLRDCVQCATWLKKWLGRIGVEAELTVPQVRGKREEVKRKVCLLRQPFPSCTRN